MPEIKFKFPVTRREGEEKTQAVKQKLETLVTLFHKLIVGDSHIPLTLCTLFMFFKVGMTYLL